MTRLRTRIVHLLDEVGQRQLAGDLIEEFEAGRSRLWFCRQAAAGLLAGVFATARRLPYLTFRAAAIGWITLMLVNGRLPFNPHPEVNAWVRTSPFWMVLIFAQYFLSGWVVGRLHPTHRTAMVLATTLFLATANAFAVAVPVALIWSMNASGRPPLSPGWFIYSVTLLLLPAATVIGGLWGGREPAQRGVGS